jgi:2-polyprenyl-3-methyl-5-hydroxy-6-metoxy-1,4-benzoquinol methylase
MSRGVAILETEISSLEEVVAAHPEDALAHADLGGLFLRQGNKERSESHYSTSLRLQKIAVLLYSARRAAEANQSGKALELCDQALDLEPGNREALKLAASLRPASDGTPAWLACYPKTEDVYSISSQRGFAHEEADYDQQHHVSTAELNVGLGLVNLLKEKGADAAGPALEIGCGSGLLSVGLAKYGRYPLLLLTDPSAKFLQLTRRKLLRAQVDLAPARFAVLKGEELSFLPQNEFSLVVLRSVLHHVPDVEAFIRTVAASLRPGGVLTFQEPCMEGFVLLGAMAQFIPQVLKAAGHELDEAQLKQVDVLVRTMQFYARRDVDKSSAEDKHLFRVDELMKTCSDCGLEMEFMPNMTYESYSAPPGDRTAQWSFSVFFHDYLSCLMSFDPGLMKLIEEHFLSYCGYLDVLTAKGNGPYIQGVFVCRKK